MIYLILSSVIIQALIVPALFSGQSFIFYLFIAFLEFATMIIAVTLKHEYRSHLLNVLLASIIIHSVWSVVEFLALSLAKGSVILWDAGYQNIYPPLFDLIKYFAFVLTVIELLILFTPTIIRLSDGFIRGFSINTTTSHGGYFNIKGHFIPQRERRSKENQR